MFLIEYKVVLVLDKNSEDVPSTYQVVIYMTGKSVSDTYLTTSRKCRMRYSIKIVISMTWKGHVLGAKVTTNVDELIHQNGKYRLGNGHVLGAKLTTNVDELIHQNGKSMTWKR
jgi:ribosomal protein S16